MFGTTGSCAADLVTAAAGLEGVTPDQPRWDLDAQPRVRVGPIARLLREQHPRWKKGHVGHVPPSPCL